MLPLVFVASSFAQQGSAIARGEAVYVITHVDVMGDKAVPALALLTQFAADTLKEKDCSRFEVLQQDGRPNHFTVVAIWRNRAAFEAHDSSAWTKSFREKIQPMVGSPWDERLHQLVKQ